MTEATTEIETGTDLNPAVMGAEGATESQTGSEGSQTPASAKTVAGGNTDGVQVTADFPNDWQAKMAGDDEKAAKVLSRYTKPADVAKALVEARDTISQGVPKRERPGAEATDEQWAEYRQAEGLPETAEAYAEGLSLPDGIEVGEADKAMVGAFAEAMHGAGIPPEALSVAYNKYLEIEEQAADIQADEDDQHRVDSLSTLKQEHGSQLDMALATTRAAFADVSDDAFDQMMTSRLPNGRLLGNDPVILNSLMALSRQANPGAAVVPNSDNAEKSINEEIASYEKQMRADRDGWHKDKAAQERYRELLDAKDRLKAA